MSESVEGGGAEQSVGEGIAPLGEVEVGGDDGGALFVALGDEVVEVLVLRGSQGFQSEVVDDEQRERAAAMYTLIVTAKLNDVDPQDWLADVLARIAELPHTRVHELLPWNWKAARDQALAA